MHALSVQYYEVVQAFRVTTQLERAEKCLFVPLGLVSFQDPTIVDRWRLVLADAALSQRTRRQLTVEYGVVEVIPQTPPVTPGRILVTETRGTGPTRGGGGATPGSGAEGGTAPGRGEGAPPATPDVPAETAVAVDYRRAPVTSPLAVLAVKGWNIEQLTAIGWATGRVLAQARSDSVFVSDDALLMGFTLRDGQAARFAVRRRDGGEVAVEHASASAVAFRDPVPIGELQAIAIQTTGDRDLRTALVLQLNVLGTAFPLDVPVALRPMSALQDAVKFGGVAAARELVEHLEANRLHYSQAIYRALDPAAIAALLAPYTYRGLPLGQVVDPQPVAVTANFLVFRESVSATGRTDDQRWAGEETAWREWLGRRGLNRPAPKTEIIPLPSGGVFAEAVLGRYNAAEKVDLTRFWNWQDSPIPLTAPEIAPVQAGSRAEPEDLRPGQLSQPVVNIQAPTALPDPTGVAAILTAIQNGNLFRDMSGLAQNAALAQAALQATAQGATAAGEQAGVNMKTVVDANTERMRIAAQLAGGGGLGGPGAGVGAAPARNVTEEGGRLNQARALDERAAARALSPPASGPQTPQGAASGDGSAPGSFEEALFNRQTGGVGEAVADRLVEGADFDDATDGSAFRGPSRRRRRRGVVPSLLQFGLRIQLLNPDGAIAPTTIDARWVYYGWFEDGSDLGDAGDWKPIKIGNVPVDYRTVSESSASRFFLGTIGLLPGDVSLPVDEDFVRYAFFQVPAEGLLKRPPWRIFFKTTLSVRWREVLKNDAETLDHALIREGIKPRDVVHRGTPSPATGGEIWGVAYLDYDFNLAQSDISVFYK
jgi:hypothetical protein